jgi:hypothetical protein
MLHPIQRAPAGLTPTRYQSSGMNLCSGSSPEPASARRSGAGAGGLGWRMPWGHFLQRAGQRWLPLLWGQGWGWG